MPMITCPHCGARRNTPQHRLPDRPVRANCPECRNSFHFDPNATPPEEPSRRIVCPHCGLSRTLPAGRSASRHDKLSCRRCQQTFSARIQQSPGDTKPPGTEAPPTTQVGLPSIGSLLTRSWEIFCQRSWGLIGIYLLLILGLALPLAGALSLFAIPLQESRTVILLATAAGILYGILLTTWMTAGMFYHVTDQSLGITSALKLGWQNIGRFFWLLAIISFILCGSSLLLLIPGMVLAIWLLFSQYVLVDDGIGGLAALEKSHQLVRGHWWGVFGRVLLLLLLSLALSTLAARLPLIGSGINFVFSLLLTPFSLIYYFVIFQDLKRCQRANPLAGRGKPRRLHLTIALLGWLIVPGILTLLAMNPLSRPDITASAVQKLTLTGALSADDMLALSDGSQPGPRPPAFEPLSVLDYDRLLGSLQLPAQKQGVSLGPATLTAEQFWDDPQAPHLWLKLQLADLPNLPLAKARIEIDEVTDESSRNLYNPAHTFEGNAFQRVDVSRDAQLSEERTGIRSVYLKKGTDPEEVRRINGRLELNLPLGIETQTIDRSDIGKTLQIAGKPFTIERFDAQGITLSFKGKPDELLSISALNGAAEPLPHAGLSWQEEGPLITLKQMFTGQVNSVTLLVAADSTTRSYPFEIVR